MSKSKKDSTWYQLFGVGVITVLAIVLIRLFSRKEERYKCPNCNADIVKGESPCHNCNEELDWPNE